MEAKCSLWLMCGCLLALGAGVVRGSADHHQLNEDGTILIVPELMMLLQVEATPNPNVTLEQTDVIIKELYLRVGCTTADCQCLDATKLFTLLGVAPTSQLTEEQYKTAAPVLLFYIHDVTKSCEAAIQDKPLQYFTNFLVQGEFPSEVKDRSFRAWLQHMMDKVETTYVRKPMLEEEEEAPHGHGDGGHTHDEHSHDEHPVENEFCADAYRLLSDLKINTQNATAAEAGHAAALGLLHMLQGEQLDTHCSAAPYKDEMLRHMLTVSGVGYDEPITLEFMKELLTKLKIGSSSNVTVSLHTHDGEKGGHAHGRRRRATDTAAATDKCLSAEELLWGVYGVDYLTGTAVTIRDLAPSLLQQQMSGVCAPTALPIPGSGLTSSQVYGYGILAVLIISLLSLFGVVFVPCASKRWYKEVMSVCIGMAVGTLIADSVFHLLPAAFGIHSHSYVYTQEGPSFVFESHLTKGMGIAAAVYFFFLVESLMANILPSAQTHSHSIDMKLGKAENGGHDNNGFANGSIASPEDVELDPLKRDDIREIRPVAVMIILGGALHNFADGVAIGTAFSVSIPGGLTTSLAVFCHEVPHELGDFAVLLNTGMKVKWAALLNFLSALTAVIGVVVGGGVSLLSEEIQMWMLTVAVGMFLYVSLVGMVPELVSIQSKTAGRGARFCVFLMQSVGFILGLGIVLLVQLSEKSFIALF